MIIFEAARKKHKHRLPHIARRRLRLSLHALQNIRAIQWQWRDLTKWKIPNQNFKTFVAEARADLYAMGPSLTLALWQACHLWDKIENKL